ncbi:L,D-transpeptidase [Hoeflea sp. G2-23]|uniref:L,D-transpeptidase n=1 Tax=Hoeflea algicola TaxID=2983763 RepID=A0ABT3Z7D6_9HYPH|nr:L,D-transpeptidase [Hoeflea algicola]MCY0147688.1 L,D-transpeptidase [Hoeflea algicola]
MLTRSKTRFAAVLLSLGVLSAPQAFAAGEPMVLVTTDGQLMQDIPEAGTVRIVIDNQGRRLVIDRWNEVIGFEIPTWQYQQTEPRGERRRHQRRQFDRFPEQPLPPRDDYATTEPQASIERRDLNPTTSSVREQRDEEFRAPDVSAEPAPITTPKAAATPKLTKAQVAALQVYLDRNGVSPGVIDGRMGSNVQKALNSWYEISGERIDPAKTDEIVTRLANSGGLAFTTYTISAEDAAGPFIASVPSDYAEKAKLERLAFTSTLEMLAERFHMDEDFLTELNPGVDFTRPGVQIKVVATGEKNTATITRIVADKGNKQVRGYDAQGKLVAAYPATIGSTATPSPTGTYNVERVVRNPGYTYNPKINFKQGDNDKVLEVPPGPNGPVGSVWIALSKPTYGIHGTPEPSKIGKTSSNGCVRLTNWDAEELTGMVAPGVIVSFIE